jgi:hypothetical protein
MTKPKAKCRSGKDYFPIGAPVIVCRPDAIRVVTKTKIFQVNLGTEEAQVWPRPPIPREAGK